MSAKKTPVPRMKLNTPLHFGEIEKAITPVKNDVDNKQSIENVESKKNLREEEITKKLENKTVIESKTDPLEENKGEEIRDIEKGNESFEDIKAKLHSLIDREKKEPYSTQLTAGVKKKLELIITAVEMGQNDFLGCMITSFYQENEKKIKKIIRNKFNL